jgi:methanogenic corrinoid protein MtbC1
MKGYSLDDVKKRIIEALKEEETGLSGVELAKKTSINRVTLSKYLKMLETMGLIKRKSLGISNVWYLDQSMEDASNVKDILDIRKFYMDTLLSYKDGKSIILNAIHSSIDPINIIIEVIVPSVNTAYELYNRGSITASEVMIINNLALESLVLIKMNVNKSNKSKASAIFMNAPLESNIIGSKVLEIIFYIKGWTTYFLGSPSLESDLLFDIDLMRFINKIWKEDELLLISIYANEVGHIQGIKEVIEDIRSKTGKLHILAFTPSDSMTFDDKDYNTDDLNKAIEWAEMLYNKFRV